ncbi:hypothetical protein HU200_063971 [Digitaria exilis]|uniref:DUF1618 domain-containing protein n=1 Tax=Digitaria exilis TaxID=1010633 RepID=A0A835DYM0_9POAL|nr:hypothetical protein HU200_063971 [Digitaria exilis]
MNRSYPMATASSSANSDGEGHVNGQSSILLDVRAYSAARRNSSTARSETSTGHPIEVTLYTACPPVLSHLCVHCPGLQLPPADLNLAPKVIAADADFILLRVPVDIRGKSFHYYNDYFVYSFSHPKLDLLPKSCDSCFGDEELAILGCGGDKQQYVVAALEIRSPLDEFTFTLHLYKPGGSWTSQPVSVEEPLRDKVCPVPRTARKLMYHNTYKVIVIGGAKGTIGWVDLWRGILFCDVLQESPKLRDMPLPLPSKGNWGLFMNSCAYFHRDITVNQHKDSIKFVEMEIIQPREVTKTPSKSEPVSYHEWLHQQECPPQPATCFFVPGRFKANTWSMPIPITSWDDWHLDCTAQLGDLQVDNPKHYQLLRKLMSSSGNKQETTEATISLGCLRMAYPALSMEDDVVYLLTKPASIGKMGMMIAVDLRKKELQGVAKLDSKKNTSFIRCYLASRISKHLKTTGTRELLEQPEEHIPNLNKDRKGEQKPCLGCGSLCERED